MTSSPFPAVREAVAGPLRARAVLLLVLPQGPTPEADRRHTRVLAADDPDLPQVVSAVDAAFADRDELARATPASAAS